MLTQLEAKGQKSPYSYHNLHGPKRSDSQRRRIDRSVFDCLKGAVLKGKARNGIPSSVHHLRKKLQLESGFTPVRCISNLMLDDFGGNIALFISRR
jgi:hypothetical protein